MSSGLEQMNATDLRMVGNQWFKHFKTEKKLDDKRRCLHRAMEWYERSRDKAARHEHKELSSAYKNIAVCYSNLEEIECRRTTELHFLRECARARAKALEHGELSQTGAWLQSIQLDLECVVQKFISRDNGLVEETLADILRCILVDVQLPQYHCMMANHRLDQCERIMNKAMELIGDKKYEKGLSYLGEVYFPLEETKRHGKHDPKVASEANVHQGEFDSFCCVARALQAYHNGEKMLENAKKGRNIEEKSNYGLLAMDQFKFAEVLSRGEDVEVVAMAQAKIGHTLHRVFKMNTRAHLCYNEAHNIATTLYGNNYTRPWYRQLTDDMQQLRDEEEAEENKKWENKRKPYLEQLKDELKKLEEQRNTDVHDLIDFIFKTFPLKHVEMSTKPDKTEKQKKSLLKVVKLYHPDKIDSEKFGLKYYVLCEEITKVLNDRYNRIKLDE